MLITSLTHEPYREQPGAKTATPTFTNLWTVKYFPPLPSCGWAIIHHCCWKLRRLEGSFECTLTLTELRSQPRAATKHIRRHWRPSVDLVTTGPVWEGSSLSFVCRRKGLSRTFHALCDGLLHPALLHLTVTCTWSHRVPEHKVRALHTWLLFKTALVNDCISPVSDQDKVENRLLRSRRSQVKLTCGWQRLRRCFLSGR